MTVTNYPDNFVTFHYHDEKQLRQLTVFLEYFFYVKVITIKRCFEKQVRGAKFLKLQI